MTRPGGESSRAGTRPECLARLGLGRQVICDPCWGEIADHHVGPGLRFQESVADEYVKTAAGLRTNDPISLHIVRNGSALVY